MIMTDWPSVAAAAAVGAAGLYLGNSIHRRIRAEIDSHVAEKRFGSYAALWAKTKLASPMRTEPLSEAERETLFKDLTGWYYEAGNGMLLSQDVRNIYLKAKKNLTCPVDELQPESLRDRVRAGDTPDQVRGQASIDQLSILRTSMRADIKIYTSPYDEELDDEDIAFLVECNVDIGRSPWKDARTRASEPRDA